MKMGLLQEVPFFYAYILKKNSFGTSEEESRCFVMKNEVNSMSSDLCRFIGKLIRDIPNLEIWKNLKGILISTNIFEILNLNFQASIQKIIVGITLLKHCLNFLINNIFHLFNIRLLLR